MGNVYRGHKESEVRGGLDLMCLELPQAKKVVSRAWDLKDRCTKASAEGFTLWPYNRSCTTL